MRAMLFTIFFIVAVFCNHVFMYNCVTFLKKLILLKLSESFFTGMLVLRSRFPASKYSKRIFPAHRERSSLLAFVAVWSFHIS